MDSIKQAIRNIENNRQRALDEAKGIKDLLLKNENYLSIENKLGGLDFEKAKREVYGQDVAEINKEIESLRGEEERLLRTLGYSKEDLLPKYNCKKCHDSGRINGEQCDCVERERVRIELLNNPSLNEVKQLKKLEFSIYGNNAEFFKKCAKYLMVNIVDKEGNKSIFTLLGETGVGKSYIAKAAVRQCLEIGDSVIVINAIKLNKMFLEYHCAPIENKKEILKDIENCDVLLIDDLGVEQILKNVTLSYFYELIIDRIGKKTIITTNLTQRDIELRYDQRIFSRLMDKVNSAVILLNGNDLRI
jgi:DNA replication protein DnaC